MKQLSDGNSFEIIKQEEETNNPPPKIDMIAKGIVTGVVASTIVQTGRGVIGKLVRNPLVMFGCGVATGYFVHKYRKEIVAVSSQAAEQGKDFLLRQKQGIQNLLKTSEENPEKPRDLH